MSYIVFKTDEGVAVMVPASAFTISHYGGVTYIEKLDSEFKYEGCTDISVSGTATNAFSCFLTISAFKELI